MTNNVLFALLLFLSPTIQFVESDKRIALFPDFPISALSIKNNACKKDSELYVNELKKTTMWALKMWDATAKSTEGILVGSIYQMGNFHECIETQVPFRTQYCLVTITAHVKNGFGSYDQNNVSYPKNNDFSTILERITAPADRSREPKNYIKAAWCVPASCSITDLNETLTINLANMNTSLSNQEIVYTTTLSEKECQIYEPWTMDVLDITFCVLTITLITIVISVTIYDYYMEKCGCCITDKFHRTIVSFSARKNFSDLLKIDQHDSLVVLHGIRALSCLSVIIMHEFAILGASGTSKNLDDFENVYGGQHPLRFILYHSDVLVDTFFTLSGFLTAYSIFKSPKNIAVKAWKLIVLRYMRLTPVYAYVLFYYATLFSFTGSGPLWKRSITDQRELCRQNWYINLLYIHNFFRGNPETLCMAHTWSLACEFHFFIVGLLICLAITYNKNAGLSLLFAVTTASAVGTFFKIYIEERTPLLLLYPNWMKDPEFEDTYIKSHLRAAPYFIGLYFGYLYCKHYDPKKRINVIRSVLIFICSFATLIAVVFSAAKFFNQNQEYNAFESATYGALNRVIWSIGLVGIIFVTTCGSISLVYEILSWKIWIPLSKLTYAAYIIHFQFQLRKFAMATSPIDFSMSNMLLQGVSDCFYAFVTGLILYLVVEMPFRRILNLFIFNKNIKSKESISKENVGNGNVSEKMKLK